MCIVKICSNRTNKLEKRCSPLNDSLIVFFLSNRGFNDNNDDGLFDDSGLEERTFRFSISLILMYIIIIRIPNASDDWDNINNNDNNDSSFNNSGSSKFDFVFFDLTRTFFRF